MNQTPLPTLLNKESQNQIISYLRSRHSIFESFSNLRAQMERRDLAYQRERDMTTEQLQASVANRRGDFSKIKNFEVPVVLPQVESAVTYQSAVFLQGNPLFGVVSSPEFADQALALETLIDDQSTTGGWVREFILAFRKAFKYNWSPIEVSWHKDVQVSVATDYAESPTAKPLTTTWEGNKLKSLDPYNTFFDTRVPPAEVYRRGEFVGTTEVMSHIELKDFLQKLPERINVTEAINSTVMLDLYYIPQINQSLLATQLIQYAGGWDEWFGLSTEQKRLAYKSIYQVTTLYARILPAQFGLQVPEKNTPQIWKFVIINGSVVVYAEKLTNAHNWLPILIMQPNEDGLGLQTKGLAENVEVVQDVTSSLMSSVIAARRLSVHGRTLYDATRIKKSAIESTNPYIPVRGIMNESPISAAVYPFPFRDDQSGIILQESDRFFALANVISGQNPARGGQFVKGNKTKFEYADVMANANGRDQLCSLLIEAQVMTPLKYILKTNILQYQANKVLYNRDQQTTVEIDPIKLRQAVLEFKISDGLTPAEKLASLDVYKVAFQVLGSSPQISSEYNIGPLFSYLMKMQGADLRPFEKPLNQRQYEQAVAQWSQTVQTLLKSNPELTAEQLPPQPMPQQFGLTQQ